jgi:pimeloyl-ACP methyl ester carboxylesterase
MRDTRLIGVETMNRLLLVHGAFHGAWCWDKLTPELDLRGIDHEEVDLPFDSWPEEIAVVRAAIDRLGSDGRGVTVLGHSFGGAIISGAAAEEGAPYGNTKSLIYLTAVMLGADQTPDQGDGDQGDGAGTTAIKIDGETASCDPASARSVFYHRCSIEDSDWATKHLRPMPSALLFSPPPGLPAWRLLPSTYILCADDRIISLPAQQHMAANAGATVSIDSDHSPFLSCPGVLADALQEILRHSEDQIGVSG